MERFMKKDKVTRGKLLEKNAKQDMLRKLIEAYNRSSQTPFEIVGECVDPEIGMTMFIGAKAPIKNR
jgi:hypothetical protein